LWDALGLPYGGTKNLRAFRSQNKNEENGDSRKRARKASARYYRQSIGV